MHWSLDQLHDLHDDEYQALIEWAKERAKPTGDDGSVDMDQVIDEKKRAEEATRGSE